MKISRRYLLKKLGIGVGVLAVTQSINAMGLPTGVASSLAVEQGTVLLIGAGSRGTRFSSLLKTHSNGLQVVGIAEKRKKRFDALNQPAARWFRDWKEALEKPKMAEKVFVSAPLSQYPAICRMALKAGYDIWLDQLVAYNLDTINELNQLASEYGRQIMICHVLPDRLIIQDHQVVPV